MDLFKMVDTSKLVGERKQLPTPINLHRLFEKAVRENNKSKETGLYFQNAFLSYHDLNREANFAARELKRLIDEKNSMILDSVDKKITIAVDIEPSHGLLIALLAILKIGAAYVPVDSVSAINRVKYVLNQSQPVCILVDDNSVFKKDLDTVWSKFFVLDVQNLLGSEDKESKDFLDLDDSEILRQQTLMSMIYTSGSTGKPKGVCITHKSVMNRVYWQWQTYPFDTDEIACFKTSLLFVDSIIEIFSALLQLIPMVICPKGVSANPEAFVQLLEDHKVSRLVMVPSMLKNILFYLTIAGGASRLPHLNFWICNSETLKPSLLQSFFEMFISGKTFANFYGSTETMADCTSEIFTKKEDIALKNLDGNLSIGFPMCNNNCYIVDEDLNLLQVGEIGEICVAGFNVADGYLDGEVSNKSFLKNPFAEDDGYGILYKTGDFGRIYKGMIIYEGRRDSQVKIRGQRVNISEIENVIHDCPGVDKNVVLCHQFSEVSSVIVAYYTTLNKKRHTRLESAITEQCKTSLPPYMRPKLLYLEEIPLQPNTGKVDRVALRKKYERAFNRQSSRELDVVDDKARKALNILALNLNLPTGAVSKNSTKSFFELGGNSVSMIATIVQLKDYGLHIPIEDFSSAKSIQQIINHVTISTTPIGETFETHKYVVRGLAEIKNNERIIDVLADSFVEKEPLDVLLGVTKDEFMPFAKSLFDQASKNNMSLIVLDKETDEVLGGDFLFDYFEVRIIC